ncbi:MAG: beta-ketoacyl synthase [Thermodesulfobacteriota bacterium]|nr:beta-ketoacyl synthase [Thermodesulfobacteriota bacterium]
MQNSVCIVGVGALTSIGLNAPATAAAARAGIAYFNEHPYMINREADPYILAMVPTLDTGIMGVDRFIRLALPAMKEALTPLAELGEAVGHIQAKIGVPEDRPGFPRDLQAKLSDEVKKLSSESYLISETEIIAKGHSAGLMALESGSQEINKRTCDFCLLGGVDSYVNPDTLDWLEENEQVHMPANAWGFIPGEASSFCLICSQDTADKYNLPVKARLVTISTALEENRIKTETVCIGQGLTRAVRNCLKELPTDCRIDYTICDQNGEAYRADEFGFMLARLSEYFVDPSDYMAPADCWGDVGAASGPLFINLIISAAEKGYAKGPRTLLWTSSEGGERTAAILEADMKERGAA